MVQIYETTVNIAFKICPKSKKRRLPDKPNMDKQITKYALCFVKQKGWQQAKLIKLSSVQTRNSLVQIKSMFSFAWTIIIHHYIQRGIIIQAEITYKNIPCYMHNSVCRWLIFENAKIFWSYVRHFWIFPRKTNCRILIGLYISVFRNHPIMFLDRVNKMKLLPASFSYFL